MKRLALFPDSMTGKNCDKIGHAISISAVLKRHCRARICGLSTTYPSSHCRHKRRSVAPNSKVLIASTKPSWRNLAASKRNQSGFSLAMC